MLSSVASVSPNASALGNDVFNVFVQGMESLACVEQDNYSARFLYRPPVFSDPLFQNVTIGYVFAEVPKILNDLKKDLEVSKSSLIDLEAYGENYGDRAEGICHRDRLSEKTQQWDATVRTRQRKALR